MTLAGKFRIEDQPTYGVVVRCIDAEDADEFEDFLSEKNYVLFHTKFEGTEVLFYFGQASSVDSVKMLLDRFAQDNGE